MAERRKLIVVSNRGPVSYSRQNGERVAKRGGGGLVTALRDGGRIRGSGAEVWNHYFHAWTFRGRKVIWLSSHTNRDDALRAVGLAE